jgi:trk system potassium uptake protein
MLIKLSKYSPARIILFSFFFTILAGTILLALEVSRTTSVAWIDLFFTATSATCVTGLFTIPLYNTFTFFGKCVLLALVQIGGLGLITMTLFFVSLFVDFGLGAQMIAGQIL